MLADVALNVPLRAGDRAFTFAVPGGLEERIQLGTAVRVPFGNQTTTGFVVGLPTETTREVRPIAGIDDRAPTLPPDLVALASWMADYYVCSIGEAVQVMIPPLSAARRQPVAAGSDTIHAEPSPPSNPGELSRLLALRPRPRVAVLADDERFSAYLDALRWLEAEGGGAIFLVPEVVQAEALLAWMQRHTALPIALIHGALDEAKRWATWRQIRSGVIRIVVGTRLAVFAPLARVSLIVVDHEEDASYKEERTPRYHARRVAEERALRSGAGLIWGTPVPSTEVMRAVTEARALTIALPAGQPPAVVISDVRAEAGPLGGLFGRRLYQALAGTLRQERAILYVPRRGYADFLLCHECGWVPRCPRCDVAMTYHRRQVRLECHLCGTSAPPPPVCRNCRGTHLRPHGVGTERAERAARRLFRSAPILRLDTDVAADETTQQQIWQQFARRGGLLIGTQLLVKGVGRVAAPVVGAIGIEAGLNLPDFRAAERTYQILGRLAGLAQREMIIQTFAPTHPVLVALRRHDAGRFYRDELASRQRYHYPPYHTLVKLLVSGPEAQPVQEIAQRVAGELGEGSEVLGPSPAPLARMRGRHRWQVLVKELEEGAARARLGALLREMVTPRGVKISVDVDPVELL